MREREKERERDEMEGRERERSVFAGALRVPNDAPYFAG